MKIIANQNKDLLDITFNYSPKLIEIVKAIPGRKWEPTRKVWTVPVGNLEQAIKRLVPVGFVVDSSLKEVYFSTHQEHEDLKKIKAGELGFETDLPLYDFQKTGAAFIKRATGSLVADEMGTGKTLQTIAALQDGKNKLVLCPASLKYNWADEIVKWTGHTPIVVDGKKPERVSKWQSLNTWHIANYELLIHDFEDMPKTWGTIICDEATRIANTRTQTYKKLKKLVSGKRVALTGTPVSNSPLDVFGIMNWLYPDMLGSFYHFREKYCLLDPTFGNPIGFKSLDLLADDIEPYMIRRTKAEVLKDFPPKTTQTMKFDLSPEEQEVYNDIKEELGQKLKKDMDKGTLSSVLVRMLRLKQATNSLKLVTDNKDKSTKFEMVQDILKMISDSGGKAIVFTQFKTMAHILLNELNEYKPMGIYGDIPSKDRQKMVKFFNEKDMCKVMIMTEAGAYGLNLQAARYVIHYDLPWSIAKLRQREDRAHRIGQTHGVTVYNMIAQNTIDEYVMKKLYSKQDMSDTLLKEDTKISMSDIADILF